jgi:signal recognition particle receptor subunit beta
MAQVNYEKRKIVAKIVYYGPAYSGKTTSLQWLYNKLDPKHVEELHAINTEEDRTLFFDLLPIVFTELNKINLHVKLYTVPGQVKYNSTRKVVLQGVDAIVFVSDSEARRYKDNIESLNNLTDNLAEMGVNIHDIPIVLQHNKRDCAGILPLDVMDEMLNSGQWPSFGSIAISPDDSGVLESFIGILDVMIKSFVKRYLPQRTEEETEQISHKLENELRKQIRSGWDLKI